MTTSTGTRREPRLMRGEVIHTRREPTHHRFRANVVVFQLPLVSMAAQQATGGWAWGLDRTALLQVKTRDHGDGRPLLDWARSQLQAAGIRGVDGEIWLSCLPRCLGYAFKPVSFWFCENRGGDTVAVIAEVNNTFGERHAYVLDCGSGYRPGQTLGHDKDFYVSPFFPAKGRYQFRFRHESDAHGAALARIEVMGPRGPTLVTSISGRTQALTQRSACAAWAMHPFQSLWVIALIHWHGLRLWVKRVPLVPRKGTAT